MEKTKTSQIFSYVGSGLMLLALVLPYISVSVFGQAVLSLDLVFDMGKLGKANGLMYLISILGIGTLAYCTYMSFATKPDFIKLSYACLAYFVIIFIMYFVVKSDIIEATGLSRYEAKLYSEFMKIGIGAFMPLLAGGAFFMAEKANAKENTEVQS